VGAGFVLTFAPIARPVPASDGSPAVCPAQMAFTSGVCMDRYEARLLERSEDGSLTPFPPFARPKQGTFVAESRAGVRPQGYISQLEAASACQNAGKRLCTVSEWYRACRGEQHTLYPYGAKYVRGRCNVGKPHLLSILHGGDPRAWSYETGFNDPALDQRPGFLADTGEYSGCVTSAGIFDLIGNLHEWVSDRVNASIAEILPLKPGIRARIGRNLGKGVFMGGFFSTTNEHGEGCEFVTMAHELSYHDYSTGFRCCKDP
ncbi:MAG TPA: SUMF1/EgtB/PvdO family nonheme iron enzyme, partial [Polyangiaceae bacterium]